VTPPRRNQPNDRTQRTAARLLAIAPRITELVEHHRDELSTLGFPGSSGDPKVRGGKAALTPTERDANGEALCCDKQRGRDGVLEWGDPLCADLPALHGLCSRCLKRETRWRSQHGLPFRGEPAA
jgi:hypothetical protein